MQVFENCYQNKLQVSYSIFSQALVMCCGVDIQYRLLKRPWGVSGCFGGEKNTPQKHTCIERSRK